MMPQGIGYPPGFMPAQPDATRAALGATQMRDPRRGEAGPSDADVRNEAAPNPATAPGTPKQDPISQLPTKVLERNLTVLDSLLDDLSGHPESFLTTKQAIQQDIMKTQAELEKRPDRKPVKTPAATGSALGAGTPPPGPLGAGPR